MHLNTILQTLYCNWENVPDDTGEAIIFFLIKPMVRFTLLSSHSANKTNPLRDSRLCTTKWNYMQNRQAREKKRNYMQNRLEISTTSRKSRKTIKKPKSTKKQLTVQAPSQCRRPLFYCYQKKCPSY